MFRRISFYKESSYLVNFHLWYGREVLSISLKITSVDGKSSFLYNRLCIIIYDQKLRCSSHTCEYRTENIPQSKAPALSAITLHWLRFRYSKKKYHSILYELSTNLEEIACIKFHPDIGYLVYFSFSFFRITEIIISLRSYLKISLFPKITMGIVWKIIVF